MKFDFDKIVDRSAWNSKKYDKLQALYGRSDLLPLWIADMNFESPKCVQEELKRIAAYDIYGYFSEPQEYRDSIIDWYKQEYGWTLQREWIAFIPGLVHGLSFAVQGLTQFGDKILVQTPVYYAFFKLPAALGREIVENPIVPVEGAKPGEEYYKMDLEGLEATLCHHESTGNPVKLMILCNPQNPQGVRWTREELIGVAKICKKHNVIVISDESFCDLQLWGGKHIPFATVCPEAAEIAITFGTPTKTFNLSGLVTSFGIIENKEIADKFYGYLETCEYNYPLFFSMMPSIAAFRKGRPWLTELIKYIEGNVETFEALCADFKDSEGNQYIVPERPQTSYLVWIDCRRLLAHLAGKPQSELTLEDHKLLENYFVEKCHLALNSGAGYGEQGVGYMRVNLAMPRSIIQSIKLNQL